jgi:hypothetical protein
LGGAPDTPPSKVCLDSPQSSTSITTVYVNPPKANAGAGDDTDLDGLDDASGLYPRWTIFGSRGSSSLNIMGDLRKPYQSPPSIPSDNGYVERIVQLECFWIDDDGCGAECDRDANHTYISPDESMWDPDLLAKTGTLTGPAARAAIDADGDCLMNSAYDQPNWPAIDLVDNPVGAATCGTADGWVNYSVNPIAVSHNKAQDQDCDGLVDGIEWFWGGNDLVNDAKDFDNDGAPDFIEMFQFTNPKVPDTDGDGLADKPENNYKAASIPSLQCTNQCISNVDDDSDGKVNDGCLKVGAAAEAGAACADTVDSDGDGWVNDGCPIVGTAAEQNNDWDDDGDGRVNDGCPVVGAAETGSRCIDNLDNDSDGVVNDGCPVWPTGGVAEGVAGEKDEAANLDDNCPTVANPGQLNSDGLGRNNGLIANIYASNPIQDKLGDACDTDNDNDSAVDGYETVMGTDPYKVDTDGDTVNDGAELRLQLSSPTLVDPLDPLKKPLWGTQQTYYRGCNINVNDAEPPAGYSPDFDEQDPTFNGVEQDVDGDGILCNVSPTDKDSDNGTGNFLPALAELQDSTEAYGYNTIVTNVDSDGDLCPDWVEVMDIDGDRTVGVGDQLGLALRTGGVTAPNPFEDYIYDVNKDQAPDGPNVGDDLLMALNTCDFKTGCDPCAAGEN